MPIRPPALDDRSFHDLVEELVARIPAHTPEYTDPRVGDPGRTLIELFAWLADTMLYRANLVPERQRLAFLRLLGVSMRPAAAARGLVSVQLDEDVAEAPRIRALAQIKGAVPFETRDELTVLPITADAFVKRPIRPEEEKALGAELLAQLPLAYGLSSREGRPVEPKFYVTTPVFASGSPVAAGFDVIQETVDRSLWLALLARKPELVGPAREALGNDPEGQQRILNVGIMPAIEVPRPLEDAELFEQLARRARIPHVWEITTGRTSGGSPGGAEMVALEVIRDDTSGLTRRGVIRLGLPRSSQIGALENDVRNDPAAGLGDRPPRLDDAKIAGRVVAWLRLRPLEKGQQSLRLGWVGVNAIEIDQRSTVTGRIIGSSNNSADQEMQLPAANVDPESLVLEVEEDNLGFVRWTQIADLALAGRDSAVYKLDPEASTVRFGDGVRGRIPGAGRRVRVAVMRAGGGRAGNLPPGSLKAMTAFDAKPPYPRIQRKLKVVQSLPTDGGQDAELLAEAEQRIPGILRHRDRAVTADDFRTLAVEAPGVMVARVEVLPRFKPHQRRSEVPGVVSVMVLPFKSERLPPNPRADRPFLEAVHTWLDARRPLATELYTIGCEYVPLAVTVGVTLRDGFPRDEQLLAVKEAVRRFFWPLAPGGAAFTGWPLGRAVRDREVETVVAQVPGVSEVIGVNLFRRKGSGWEQVTERNATGGFVLPIELWQLPELLAVVVVADAPPPADDPTQIPNPFADDADAGVAVPVVPEVC
ncbi:putative baseplate assembly protein [Sorangium sp. So ce375]|uniref:putative baseplate assembly protein n=1 Tax=Sorangium sp. So ce375 TaxID=3133306 RepID=UPI003F5BABA7